MAKTSFDTSPVPLRTVAENPEEGNDLAIVVTRDSSLELVEVD